MGCDERSGLPFGSRWGGVNSLLLAGVGSLIGAWTAETSESLPAAAQRVLDRYCLDCHSGEDAEGDLDLEVTRVAWRDEAAGDRWERVFDRVRAGEMPPSDKDQPTRAERGELLGWLERSLFEHRPVGGTLPRRLNRVEYEKTIRRLFDLSEFRVPDSFPADDSLEGFDNLGAGLVLSPPLMASFLDVATQVADEILPPEKGPRIAVPKRYEIGEGLATDQGGGAALAGDRYRIASSRNMASAAGWPARFEASESGIYRLSFSAQAFETESMHYPPRSEPLLLSVYARRSGEQAYDFFDNLRLLGEVSVSPGASRAQPVSLEVALYQGEVFGLRWKNGPAYSDPPVREFSTNFLASRLLNDRRYYAAMLKVKGGPRGATQSEVYELTRDAMESDDLDLMDPRLDTLPKVWGGGLSDAPHNWIKSYVLEELHRYGPALDVMDIEVEGPLRLVEDEAMRIRKARTARFLGTRGEGESDEVFVRGVLRRFLDQAFRREVGSEVVDAYAGMVMDQRAQNPEARLEDGLHLALRRALTSPQFLYRSLRPGPLDDFDLATRLSYFLTSGPPDTRLLERARARRLGDPAVLREETRRLIRSGESDSLVRHFTGQWLGNRWLKDIMPDPRLLPFFDYDRTILIEESELFFAEILRENLPLETFIAPDFSFRNAGHNKIYGGNLKGGEMRRISLPKDGRQGGVLGLASVMMATANGVDTQPILRGVWLLENVLGMPPPDPPDDVPAIAPDTRGASSIREQLDRHRADASCARCHDLIDPLGMVMENFDPVGRWREHYPVYSEPVDEPLKEEFYKNIGKGTRLGPPVEAQAELPDGTQLRDVTDLKRYLVDRIDLFATCLTEKLLTYATGRPLSFGDKRVVEAIVREVQLDGNGFQDLVVAIVESEAFRTR